jgi:hypothetical protein
MTARPWREAEETREVVRVNDEWVIFPFWTDVTDFCPCVAACLAVPSLWNWGKWRAACRSTSTLPTLDGQNPQAACPSADRDDNRRQARATLTSHIAKTTWMAGSSARDTVTTDPMEQTRRCELVMRRLIRHLFFYQHDQIERLRDLSTFWGCHCCRMPLLRPPIQPDAEQHKYFTDSYKMGHIIVFCTSEFWELGESRPETSLLWDLLQLKFLLPGQVPGQLMPTTM